MAPGDNLGAVLRKILVEYPSPRQIGRDRDYKTTADIPEVSNLLRKTAKEAVLDVLEGTSNDYKVAPALGQGSMAEIPYISIENPAETQTTQAGIYIVYLFDTEVDRLYLTLNQGSEEAKRSASRSGIRPTSKTILERHAEQYRQLIDVPPGFTPKGASLTEELDQEGETKRVSRAREYNSGAILMKSYDPDDLHDEEQLVSDLLRLIEVYERLLTQLYETPRYDLGEREVWTLSPQRDDFWDIWQENGLASIGFEEVTLDESAETPPGENSQDPMRQIYTFEREIEAGDIVIAGTSVKHIDVIFGIGRVTEDYATKMASVTNPENSGPDGFHDERFIGVEWYPFGEAGISVNCLKDGRHLSQQWALHPLNAELGHFLGAAIRRLEVTELIDDAEAELNTIEWILNIDRLLVENETAATGLERTDSSPSVPMSEQTTGASATVSDLGREILELWAEIIADYPSGRQFDLQDHYDPEEARQRARTFIDEPSREHFEALWSLLFSAQRAGSPSSIYEKWTEQKGRTDEELAVLIKDILTAETFDPNWENELGAKGTLWELFGLLHLETHPIINGSAKNGLSFFGYSGISSYRQGKELFETFKRDYEAIVGHGSAGTAHEVPINLEIDQLFNVIDKASEDEVDRESIEKVADLYRLVLNAKEDSEPIPEEQSAINHFWVTANPSIWSIHSLEPGETIDYTAVNKKDNKRRVQSAFNKVASGDRVLFYESTPTKTIVAEGTISESLHSIDEKEGYDTPVDVITIRYDQSVDPITWKQLSDVPELDGAAPIVNGAQGSLFELSESEFETILALEELTPETSSQEIQKLQSLVDPISIEISLPNELYFEDDDEIKRQIEASLNSGKHIIFTGPPGTGKSKLAKQIAKQATANLTETADPEYNGVHNWEFTTATSEWTTFDTIGGYVPDVSDGGSELIFQPRLFLNCFRDENITNRWLVIDEINRSDIDKAFGSLFSVLTGDSVTLPYKRDETVEIVSVDQQTGQERLEEIASSTDLFPVTPSWRLLATMNTYDKASLYEMSYAFMRRFNFIHIGIPSLEVDGELKTELLDPNQTDNYPAVWFKDDAPERQVLDELHQDLTAIWRDVNHYRPIGPSIIRDLIGYIHAYGVTGTTGRMTEAMTSALVALVFPQLEGLRPTEQKKLIRELSTSSKYIDDQKLRKKATDFFTIEFDE